jgi:soluble lytic murein transglycosylase
MFRSRWLLSLLVASIVGLVAAGTIAKPRRAVAQPAATAAPASPEEAFLKAREAFTQNAPDRLDLLAAQVTDPSLKAYVDYWRLRLRVNPRGGAGNASIVADPALDADVQAFIAGSDNPLLADLARRDFLYRLARRNEWAAFETHYNAWALRDESALHCYGGLARLERGAPMGEEAREALFQPRELGDACGLLIETMARAGKLKRAEIWQRLKLALEAGAANSVRRLGPLIDLPAGAVEAALQRPALIVAPSIEREVAVIALGTLARQDPEAAAQRTESIASLPPADRAWVWAQIGAHSMRKLAPVPTAWLRDALPAQASDETWAWLTRAALRAGDWRSVHALTDKMSSEGRREPTWVYWAARAHQALNLKAQSEVLMRSIAGQFHFYGQLAAEELGEPMPIPVAAAPSTAAELAEAAANPGFARALRFYQMGLRMEGNREWNFQLRTMSDRQLLAAARFACERRVLDRCVNTADRTRAEHDFSLRFVTPFRPQLEAAAVERGLDPAWVYGLIRQESRFIMDVRSSASAQGLMQIIPPTARWIARRLGVTDFRLEQLNELDTNLRFGTYYLRTVQDDLENSPLLASAGYNAGPGRPRQWRSKLTGTLEGAAFAEIIPFTETRDYVKKVLSNATFYGALMTGQPQSLKRRLGSVSPALMRPSDLP